MGYHEMPVQIRDGRLPGRAGAELDWHRRSVIKSQVQRQIYQFKYIYIPKAEICTTSISSVHAYSVAGKYAHCMQRITGFETCLHLFGTLVCIGMYWYVLVCACLHVYIHLCTGMYWYVLVILEVLV